MALKTAAQTVVANRPGPKCGFGTLLKTLSDDDYAYYQQMVADGEQWSFISKVFRADGHNVSPDKVRRHSRGECSCR